MWNFDGDGEAYVIDKDLCPVIADLPSWIIKEDNLHPDCADGIRKDIQDGWCRYECRSDWEDEDGDPHGGYVVTQCQSETKRITGKRKPGYFPVWIIRVGDWY